MIQDSKNNGKKAPSFPRDALEQAGRVKEGWDKIGGKLYVPNLSLTKFVEKLEEAKDQIERPKVSKLRRKKPFRNEMFV